MYLVEIMNNLKGKKKRVVVFVDDVIHLNDLNEAFEEETGIEVAEGSIAYDRHQNLAIYSTDEYWVNLLEV